MKGFAITTEEGQIAEVAEFSNGEVVVRWLMAPVISRFDNLDMLRGVMNAATFEQIRTEPLAQRLRRARTDAGLSQRGLAKEIGVSFSTISRIEAGHNYVSNQTLEDWLSSRA